VNHYQETGSRSSGPSKPEIELSVGSVVKKLLTVSAIILSIVLVVVLTISGTSNGSAANVTDSKLLSSLSTAGVMGEIHTTNSSLVPALPLKYKTTPVKVYSYQKLTQISVYLEAGQTALVYAKGQASTPTNPKLGYLVMHADFLKQTDTGSPLPSEGKILDVPTVGNISDAVHHSTRSCFGAFKAETAGNYKFAYIQYAAALNGSTSTRSLVVDYVNMTVVVL
jgi:hypothetical protein